MANPEHVAIIKLGAWRWNEWRRDDYEIVPDLSGADLFEANLPRANLHKVDLSGADLFSARLSWANLARANLSRANLSEADLRGADLTEANLTGASLSLANLSEAGLRGANLTGASLSGALLFSAELSEADLTKAHLAHANLSGAKMLRAKLVDADLSNCRVYGVSAWGLKLDGAKQQNLVITQYDEPVISIDSIEVAQFVHLMLHNEKIRDIIDTIGKKAVLILGWRQARWPLRIGVAIVCAAAPFGLYLGVGAQEQAPAPQTPVQQPAAPLQPSLQPPSTPAQATLSQADAELLVTLVRTTLVAVHQANLTGNYTVLRDLGAPGFRDKNSAADLAQIFAPIRQQKIDLGPVVFLDPQLSQAERTNQGMLHLVGKLATRPAPVSFELLFQPVNGVWQLFGISIAPIQGQATAAPPAPSAAAAPAAALSSAKKAAPATASKSAPKPRQRPSGEAHPPAPAQ